MLWGVSTGVVAALIMDLLLHAEMPGTGEFTFLQSVVLVWILASICEETLVRGLLQSLLWPVQERGVTVIHARVSVPVVFGGLFFAAMHLPLLGMGLRGGGMLVVLFFALLLGTSAGYVREKTGSLIPAILLHALGNIGRTLTGTLTQG